jgi:hypothetical protein
VWFDGRQIEMCHKVHQTTKDFAKMDSPLHDVSAHTEIKTPVEIKNKMKASSKTPVVVVKVEKVAASSKVKDEENKDPQPCKQSKGVNCSNIANGC